MKTSISPSTTPLSLALYTQYEKQILKTRENFFVHLKEKYSGEISERIKVKLNKRINNSLTPLLGELWPWFLKKVFPIKIENEEKFNDLVTSWIAAYLLVVEFDNACDTNDSIEPFVVMPLIVEASDLITSKDYARETVMGQLLDVKGQSNPNKNAFIFALASEVISLSPFHPLQNRYVPFMKDLCGERMLELLQVMDDIGDIEENLSYHHPSSLITQDMLHKNYRHFRDLLSDHDQLIMEHFNKVLTRLADNAEYLMKSLRGWEITFEKENEMDLTRECAFFEKIWIEAKKLSDYITRPDSYSDIGAFITEVKGKFAILAQST